MILFEAGFGVTTFLAAVHGSIDDAVLICITLPLHIPLAGRRSAQLAVLRVKSVFMCHYICVK